jgi:hypothetical protein
MFGLLTLSPEIRRMARAGFRIVPAELAKPRPGRKKKFPGISSRPVPVAACCAHRGENESP